MNPLIVKGVVFGLLLACAALWDMKEREIPNLIPAMILVCGLIELRPAASVAGLLVTGGPYLLAALLTHGKTLAIGGGDIKLMGACGFVLGVWPGLLHSILSLILAVLTGVMLFGVRRQDFSSIRLPLAPFFCIGGVTAYMLVLLRHIADYVIVDCTSLLTGNVLATTALEVADDVLRVCSCDLKAISYFSSYLSLVADRKFKPEQHIKVLSNTRPYQGGSEYENSFGGVKYRLPYLPSLEEQAAMLKLLEPLSGKEAKTYEPVIAAIAGEVFGDGK